MADDIPAFPVSAAGVNTMGMTLRDYFAGQAIQELVGFLTPKDYNDMADGVLGAKRISTVAYIVADAMLAARKRS